MGDSTDRYALTLLSAAQAHKEVSHNAALLRMDGLLHPCISGMTGASPAAPNVGEVWIVASGATGAWAQHPDEIALFQSGGWTYLKPLAGCVAWNRADGAHMVYDGIRWRADAWPMRAVEIAGKAVVTARQPAISAPSGGPVINTEVRSVVNQLLMMLRAHGLIET